jgi:urease accessory protein UreF
MNGGGWGGFTEGLFRDALGPALEQAWAAAHDGDLQALMLADDELTEKLDHDDAQRSIRAGAILLKSTRQARYQGVLGHFRDQIAAGRCSGHLATIWAATGHFFHLSLANVIAEYLRLEWEIGTRDDLKRREPNFSQITSELLLARNAEMKCV